MKITLRITKINEPETRQWNEQTFKSVLIIGETLEAKFSSKVAVEVNPDKTNISNLKVGRVADFEINIVSREYNGKYYTNIRAWKIDVLTDKPAETTTQEQPISELPKIDDNLPF